MTSIEELDRLSNEFLTLIEIQEARLLNWGFLNTYIRLDDSFWDDNSLRLPEKAQRAWANASADGLGYDKILANLEERKLIFQTSDGTYRSRFAETIRLLALLRQRFSEGDWNSASRLVSDTRIELRRRRYPKRDITIDVVLEALPPETSTLARAIIETLTRDTKGIPLELARFQQRSLNLHLMLSKQRSDHGVVIGAGTGSGKTKAFYLPALALIADALSNRAHTLVMAIYPRNELLKDQLAEAVSETHKIRETLKQAGKRPIRVGVFYGETPEEAADVAGVGFRQWEKMRGTNHYVCPFLKCPECGGSLVWTAQDLVQAKKGSDTHHRLTCTNAEQCGCVVGSDEIILTRKQARNTPPDILFTTTEMLNRSLSNLEAHRLIGLAANPPSMLLLDEVHTYSGLHGAQVAYLLRRWRHARASYKRNAPLVIVGLSATLTQAEEFFAKLSGLETHQITYISPDDSEMEEEGIEYNVVLKADPVSSTALLSTSIQTVMLLGRMLDPMDNRDVSRKTYPPRLFAFSDKLDIINRWYTNLEDAEWKKRLARHRFVFEADELRLAKYQAGQDWRASWEIGHDQNQALPLERTTSEDRGVGRGAKVVVASSTLEVGFNDPDVGAVVQHKAPRDSASFIQRKGRAGRLRRTRPWMVLVTSAYGRDRWAFQHAENLFDPLLPPTSMPLDNYYIRKMQAAYALMDWTASELNKEFSKLNVWNALTATRKNQYKERQAIGRLLTKVLEDRAQRERLEVYLKSTLQIRDEALQSILWGEPRSLILEVIPTLIRELQENWQRVFIQETQPTKLAIHNPRDEERRGNPMPDFASPNLFSDLNLPEVDIFLPGSPHPRALNLEQVFSEYPPGHINFRFGSKNAKPLYLRFAEDKVIQQPDGKYLYRLSDLTMDAKRLPYRVSSGETLVTVCQPETITLEETPQELHSNSSSRLIWQSDFAPLKLSDDSATPGREIEAVTRQLKRILAQIRVFDHTEGTAVRITRMATDVQLAYTYNGRRTDRRRFTLVEDDKQTPVAIGMQMYVDALCISFQPLKVDELRRSSDLSGWDIFVRSLRPHDFMDRLKRDPRIADNDISIFLLEWLHQLELSMLIAKAIESNLSLREAADQVHQYRRLLSRTMLDTMFQNGDVEENGKLREQLAELQANVGVTAALHEHVSCLWQAPDSTFDAYLKRVYAASIGTVVFTAIQNFVDDTSEESLALDIQGDTIWISERVGGGIGLITRIAQTIAQSPRGFEQQLMDTLRHCDHEQLALELDMITHSINAGDAKLRQAFEDVRANNDLMSVLRAREGLANALKTHGLSLRRDLMVAINTKFLRPNSSNESDDLIADIHRFWHEQQERLACIISPEVIAAAVIRDSELRPKLDTFLRYVNKSNASVDDHQLFNLVQSFLWMTCRDSCPACIEVSSRYAELTKPSRLFLSTCLGVNTISVIYGVSRWQTLVVEQLSNTGQAAIQCPFEDIQHCQRDTLDLLLRPVDTGGQLFHPFVERVNRLSDGWEIHLAVRELIGS